MASVVLVAQEYLAAHNHYLDVVFEEFVVEHIHVYYFLNHLKVFQTWLFLLKQCSYRQKLGAK